MSTTIKTGWLHDKNGDKFAPKTLTSQVQTSDGTLLEDKIQADLDAVKEEILADAGNIIAETYATKDVATTENNGLMSSEDKTKLCGDQYTIDSSIAYIKDANPDSPYAEMKEIGGMTHKVNAGTEEEPVYELRNAPVTNVESIGVNLFDISKILYGSIDSNGDLYLPSGQKRFYEGNFKKNTQYTFRAYCRTVNGGAVRLVCNYTDGSKDEFFTVYGSDTEYVGKKFVSDADKTISHISVNYGSSGGDLYIEGGELMINEGTEALPYEPFVCHTLPIPEAIRNLDGYGWGINESMYNYIDYENKQFVKRVGCVDMGTLKWTIYGDNTKYFSASVSGKPDATALLLCAPYEYNSKFSSTGHINQTISSVWLNVKNAVNVRDDNYTDAETFKAALSGIMLYYELKTPVITDISGLLPADNILEVYDNGTIAFSNEYMYEVPNKITYYNDTFDAKASIAALKKIEAQLKDKSDSDHTNVIPSVIAYGTCSTAANTAAKEITIVDNDNWQLTVGSIITVNFSYTNTAENPTLNVNGTGAKSVWYGGSVIKTSSLNKAGYSNRPITYMYDGTNYVFVSWSYDSDTTYSPASLGNGYASCTTAEATTAKTASISSYSLKAGGIVSIKFTNAVPAGSTLNIRSQGAKSIYYNGSAITSGVIEAGDTATFIYSTQYHLIAINKDKDITYATGTESAPGLTKLYTDTGTNTDGTMTQAALKTALDGKQATITGAATTINTENLTASRVLVSDSNGKVAVSPVTSTELGYLDGVTSAIQTQLNDKASNADLTTTTTTANAALPKSGGTMTGKITLDGDPTSNLHATTKQYVDNLVSSLLAASDAMVFKGTIGSSGATVTALPATHNAGWTYKVITAGTYAGATCEIGDIILCTTDGTSSNNAHWAVIQTNTDGVVTGPVLATDSHIAVFDGASGKVIKDSGFTIGKSVPSDAKFTDTTYSTGTASNAGLTKLYTDTGTNTDGSMTQKAIKSVLDGKQTTVTGGATTITESDLTASRALVSDSNGKVAVSPITSAELGYLSGATSSIQTQLNAKADLVSGKVKPDQVSSTITDESSSFTLATSNAGQFIRCTNSSAITITIPTGFTVGTEIEVCRYGTGTVTFAGMSGVTLLSADNDLTIASQYGCVALKCVDTNTWVLAGGLG